MPFIQVDISKEIESKREKEPQFKKEWDESREEYRLIGEMISLRKKEKITQSKLAELTGNKQQVISRIERKENSPSLKSFSNMLNALGYELKIVRKRIM
ncbi:MAG: XRE family transcriptional regulator [Clostridia bacterium]|jgi:DNA-binding XRE family transcriptional regulator|nr:helix-turn-helix transcriptional regulator [Lachnospiraceae bacterium]NCC01339.1 XRE family transcriptional regulator [Clostridia bacterium]NCD03177.1 XRE family transcriptional regulator [Clostridia bacterium]